MLGMNDLNGGVFHGGSFFFACVGKQGREREREREGKTSTAQYPNTEMKFGELKKKPSIFSF